MAKNKKKIIENRVLVDDISSLIGEAYQRLQVNVDIALEKHSQNVIGVTSSIENEDKSTVLVNLANIYVKKGKKVVIVDLDLRSPTVHFYFGKPNTTGIVDYVLGELDRKGLINQAPQKIDYICCGKNASFPAEILESDKLSKLIEELKKEYDLVFIDCPPTLVAADTTIISKSLDSIIIVAKENYVTKDMFSETVRILKHAEINILGAVMTNVTNKDIGYF